MAELTNLLNGIHLGDAAAAEKALVLVYNELRSLAKAKLRREGPGHTLEATALVHEMYVRLVGAQNASVWKDRRHFFTVAAEAMRRILIDHARRKKRQKRGGGQSRVDLEEESVVWQVPLDEVLAVHEALDELAKAEPQTAELVKLRYFAGLTIEEAAEVLDISERSAYRDWRFARAWLHRRIK